MAVAIVTPVYRPTIQPAERLALRQCSRILGSYDKFLVCPEGMNTSAYREVLGAFEVSPFRPEFFTSVRAYSRLLRSPAFYERFLDFEHILIYQPDAYVFSDRLAEFCAQPYDYFGAPWLDFSWLAARRKWARFVVGLPHLMNKVGNGGLSLRRTRPHYDVTARFQKLGERLDLNEDLYLTSLLARLDHRLRIADFTSALRFAFEIQPRRCFELNGSQLPFGCHAFERNDAAFWREHFDANALADVTIRTEA